MLRRSLSTHVYTIPTTLKATFFAHAFVSLFLLLAWSQCVRHPRVAVSANAITVSSIGY